MGGEMAVCSSLLQGMMGGGVCLHLEMEGWQECSESEQRVELLALNLTMRV